MKIAMAVIVLACLTGSCASGRPEESHGVLTDVASLRTDESIDGPQGCRFYQYCCNQETGIPAPPGHWWEYCVCLDTPANDPLSIPLESGWTYDESACQHDWTNH